MSVNVRDFNMKRFGGTGGDLFEFNSIETISIKHGKYVDAIVINGKSYGGTGGVQTETLKFDSDEFIEEMHVRHGQYVDYLYIKTNKGRSIKGGGNGGHLSKVGAVVGIGGHAGKYLDRIDLLCTD